jgi:hypothetical protein
MIAQKQLMPPNKKPSSKGSRTDIIRSITTPLGFFALALLIIEATLAIVLSCSKLSEEHVWEGFIWMLVIFASTLLIVTFFTWLNPKNLLYGKEEYLSPALDPLALKDGVEELIVKNVKPECLKTPPT